MIVDAEDQVGAHSQNSCSLMLWVMPLPRPTMTMTARHADDDAQHGEKSADLAAPDILEGQAEGLVRFMRPPPVLPAQSPVSRLHALASGVMGIAVVDDRGRPPGG